MSKSIEMFSIVLDRLTDAERRAGEAVNLAIDRTVLQRDLNNARSEITSLRLKVADYSNAEDAAVQLYDAVDAAANAMDSGTGDFNAIAARLREKRDALKKFIDPIPF